MTLKKKRVVSPEGRAAIAEGQRQRWAKKSGKKKPLKQAVQHITRVASLSDRDKVLTLSEKALSYLGDYELMLTAQGFTGVTDDIHIFRHALHTALEEQR